MTRREKKIIEAANKFRELSLLLERHDEARVAMRIAGGNEGVAIADADHLFDERAQARADLMAAVMGEG